MDQVGTVSFPKQRSMLLRVVTRCLTAAAVAFCVALTSTEPDDGFRINYSNSPTAQGTSWFQAAECGVSVTSPLPAVVGTDGAWCIGAIVDKLLP